MRRISVHLPRSTVGRIFWFFLGLEGLVVLLDIFVNHFRWVPVRAVRRMVNIAREDSFGTWLSSTQMLMVGMVLVLIGIATTTESGKVGKRVIGWFTLAGFFIYMGIDDAIKFHERIGTAFKVLIGGDSASAGDAVLDFFPSYTWQLVFGPFFAVMGTFIIVFLWREFKSARLFSYIAVGIGFYFMAVMLDFIEGLNKTPYSMIADSFSTSTGTIRHFSKVIEEFLEMFGTTLFLTAFMSHLLTSFPNWEINFEAREYAQ